MVPGIGFLQKNTEKCFLQAFLRYTIVFCVKVSFYLRVFCKSSKDAKAKFSLRCARQGCKSKIFSALRAPDTRENG